MRDRLESGPDGDWTVRAISGAGYTKAYRCPGCDHEILVGSPHLVIWPAADLDARDRRHWHRTCWRARGRRNPGRSHW